MGNFLEDVDGTCYPRALLISCFVCVNDEPDCAMQQNSFASYFETCPEPTQVCDTQMHAFNSSIKGDSVDLSQATITYNRSCSEKMQRTCNFKSGQCYYKEDQLLCVQCCLRNFCNDNLITETHASSFLDSEFSPEI